MTTFLFVIAGIAGILAVGAAVLGIIHQSTASSKEYEIAHPPTPAPTGYVAPDPADVDALKKKARTAFIVALIGLLVAIAFVLAGMFVPAPTAPVSSAGGPTAPVSVGPAAGAATSCTDPRPADANGFTTECGADGQWHFVPLNGIANTPVCTETERDAASKGLTYTDCQYYDVDSTWKLLSAYYAGATSSGPQSPTNTTCTQGTMPVEAGFTFTWDAGTCSWIKTAVASGGPTIITIPANPVAVNAPTNSLKYDMEGCDPNDYKSCVPTEQWDWYQKDPATRLLFPALYLQRVQAGEMTPAEAIAQIQSMAAGWAITSDNWTSYDVDPVWPTLIWNAQRNTCDYVPDTAFPLLQATGVPQEWYYSIAVVQPHLPANPAAGQIKVTCTTSDNWAVLVH